jgi:hypothetical protein
MAACTQKSNSTTSEENKAYSVHVSDSLPIVMDDKIRILTRNGFSLTGDSVDLKISDDEISIYFETADTISEKEALKQLKVYNNQYSICGEMIHKGDTLNYYILGDGIGIAYEYRHLISKKERKIAFYRNTINLPSDKYKKIKSKINILHFEKSKFDFTLWEEWKKNDTDNVYVDNNEQYKAYKQWNEKLDANGICRAFTLMELLYSEGVLNVALSVDHNCRLFGLAIMNDKLYALFMDGGGAIYLTTVKNDHDKLVYGCYKPECLKFFTNRLQTSEEMIKEDEEALSQ